MKEKAFIPLNIAIATISDTRTEADDKSGNLLKEMVINEGHSVTGKEIIPDNRYEIRAVLSRWIADDNIHAILTTGGTGFTGRDSTPEAVSVLLDKEMPGFGEVFRAISYEEIGTSTMQSRALAGLANATFIFCLPGSSGAVRTGWTQLIKQQLDCRTSPCNLVDLLPRLKEQ